MKRLILLLIAAIAVPSFGLTVTPRKGDRAGVFGAVVSHVAHQAALRIAGQ